MTSILAFFSTDPLVAWLLFGSACISIAGLVKLILLSWAQAVQRKRERPRIIQRASAPIRYPPQAGPKGGDWQKTRKSA